MTRVSQSRLFVVRTWFTWSLVFGFWFLILAQQGLSQNIPVIGGYTWVYTGTGIDSNRGNEFRSLTHVPRLHQLMGAVDINIPISGQKGHGALYVLDESTGEVLRRDSLCPAQGNLNIRSAWLNDSGTVMCYTCMGERPRLVEYPSLREIEDTILLKKDSTGGWFWTEGRVSSTGRYMILYRYAGFPNDYWLWLYDRVSGELFDLQRLSYVSANNGEEPSNRPQFGANDRLLVTRDRYMTGVTVWDVENRREIGSKREPNQRYLYMLSHTGDKLLITTVRPQQADSWSNVYVYDAWTMTPEWYRPIKNYDPPLVDHNGALSFDGSEVVLIQALETDTGTRYGSYWYALPDTTPRGYIAMLNHTAWLQPKTTGVGFLGGMFAGRPYQYAWNAALSVNTTPEEPRQPLYPNPTTGEVVVNVGECQSDSWQLRLSDQAGTLVKEGVAICSDGNVRMTLQSLPAGQYCLQISEHVSGRSVQAIVVLHR